MTLNLTAFTKAINNAADQNVLSVSDEAIAVGKKGVATLDSVDLKDLKPSEDGLKTAAKNFFIRRQLLDLIRKSLPKAGSWSDVQTQFFANAEKELFGDKDEETEERRRADTLLRNGGVRAEHFRRRARPS